jgi:hypothetical protein
MRIHVWGGLGSQLFALSLAFEVKEVSPSRKIVIVLHSSGVSKRDPEVSVLYPEFEYKFIDDFKPSETLELPNNHYSVRRKFSTLIVRLACKTRFLVRENDREGARIMPWTISVRGHYFHRPVGIRFVKELKGRLQANSKFAGEIQPYGSIPTMHYRLGDLVTLTTKGPIEPQVLVNLLEHIGDVNDLLVLSDSPTLALKRLRTAGFSGELRTEDLPTIDTIFRASNSPAFIGTSSKISYWIVLIRLYTNPESINYLPKGDKQIMDVLSETGTQVYYFE